MLSQSTKHAPCIHLLMNWNKYYNMKMQFNNKFEIYSIFILLSGTLNYYLTQSVWDTLIIYKAFKFFNSTNLINKTHP